MDVSVYINELSLNGQFCGAELQTVQNFLHCIDHLQVLLNGNVKVFYHTGLLSKELCSGTHTRLCDLRQLDRDVNGQFMALLDKASETETTQATANYHCNGKTVNNSGLSEAYDKNAKGEPTIVVSFPNSFSSSNTLSVSSVQGVQQIKNITDDDSIEEATQSFDIREKYDRSSHGYVPDKLTILTDTSLFKLSNKPTVQGRRVYERLDRKEYWYVDNAHRNGQAHLEVFNARGEHIGECDIDDIYGFRPENKVSGRSIEV